MTLNNLKSQIADLEAAMVAPRKLAEELAAMQAAVRQLAEQEQNLAGLKTRLAEAEGQERCRQSAIDRYTITNIKAGAHINNPCTVEFVERHHDSMIGQDAFRPGKMSLHGCTLELHWAVLANADKVPAMIRSLDADLDTAIRFHARAVNRGWA